MREFIAAVSSKGQVTIPADVRRHLGVGEPDKIALVIEDDGTVQLRPAQYTLDSVLGAIRSLPGESDDLDQEIAEATELEVDRKVQRWDQR